MSYFAYQWSMLGKPTPIKMYEVPCDGNGFQKPFFYLIKIPPGYMGLPLRQLEKLYPAPIQK